MTPPKPAAKKSPPAPPAPPKKAGPKKAQSVTEPVSNPLDAFNQFVLSATENIRPPPIAQRAPSISIVPSSQKKPAVDLAKQQAAAKAAAAKKKKAQDDAAAAQKAVADRRKKDAEEERKAAATANKATAERRKQEAESRKADAERKKKEAASSKAAAEQRLAAEKLAAKKQTEEKRREAAAKAKPAPSKSPTIPIANPDALNGLTKAISSATIGILGLGKPELEELPQQDGAPAKAPPGVPTLKRWRQNSDKSITGIVSGSRGFDDGDRVTTSPIASGTVAPGQLVRTGSGSRYFLS